MLTDTHTHLYLKEFDNDRVEMLERAKEAGVGKFYLPNIDSTTIGPMLEMEAGNPGVCVPMMGLHPGSVKANYEDELSIVEAWLSKRPFVAIGEIGIDLYWDKTFYEQQKASFIQQVEWAKVLRLPIIIHSRETIDLIIEILAGIKDEHLTGIFHCFTGTPQQAEEIISLGFFLGIGGVLTFKNAGLDKTVKDIPLDRIVLETDAPYLTPTPHRGKRNESAYLKLVAERLSSLKNMELEEVAAATTANAEKIFQKNPASYTTL
ncbi:MAG: TatD family hydrolase [Lewinellaceae bacterium]|nr:TatD family hydrolase [Saprospiraceae bacterium]MCB9341187.1 TatD family hydrolase [Lewinellaceae bacterium]